MHSVISASEIRIRLDETKNWTEKLRWTRPNLNHCMRLNAYSYHAILGLFWAYYLSGTYQTKVGKHR